MNTVDASAKVLDIDEGTCVHIGGTRFRVERVIEDAEPFALLVARRADLTSGEACVSSSDERFAHVDDDVHPCLWGTPHERRERFRALLDGECPWVGRAAQEQALQALHELVDRSNDTAHARLAIVGPHGAGKRSVIQRFLVERAELSGEKATPIVVVRSWTSTRGFYEACVEGLGAVGADIRLALRRPGGRDVERRRLAMDAMRSAAVRLLIIERMHHRSAHSSKSVQRRIETLDAFAAELGVALVCLSDTPLMLPETRLSRERMSRQITIDRCAPGPEFRSVISALERRLPLRRSSRLDKPAMVGRLYAATDGDIGSLWILLSELVDEAIGTGKECIDHDLLDQLMPDRIAMDAVPSEHNAS